ncbi:MAG TPA: hypothetical protein VFQ90_18900 [Stellaceae bacterium]|jgi:hypothetical protein|nr:hypothetical protein [Stellaceae bacterium]
MRRFVALLLAATLAGCSGFTPFVTAPPSLLPSESSPGKRVSICYNGLKTTPEKLQEMAQDGCLGEGNAQLLDTDYRLDNCPLMTPARATFLCKPGK